MRNVVATATLVLKPMEATMTFPDDPNLNRTNRQVAGGTTYTGWIVGLLILIAIIVIFSWANTGRNNGTASNNTPAVSKSTPTPPATTGSGTTSPKPAGAAH